MEKVIIGIDPGKNGALAAWYSQTGKTEICRFETESDAVETLRAIADYLKLEGDVGAVAYLEQVGGFVKGNASPGSAMFAFGENFGAWKGALLAFRIPFRLVRPQVWQSGYAVKKLAGAARKRALKEAARALYPDGRVTLATADALLILDYARKAEAKL